MRTQMLVIIVNPYVMIIHHRSPVFCPELKPVLIQLLIGSLHYVFYWYSKLDYSNQNSQTSNYMLCWTPHSF